MVLTDMTILKQNEKKATHRISMFTTYSNDVYAHLRTLDYAANTYLG